MFVIGNLLMGIANVLHIVLYGYMFVLIINSVLSFLPQMRYSPFKQGIETLSNIVLNPLRRVIRPIGGIDFSPYVAILVLIFADTFLVQTIADIGYRLR